MKNQKIFFFNKWSNSKSKKKFIRKTPIKNKFFYYSECSNLDLKNVIESAKIGLKNNNDYNYDCMSKWLCANGKPKVCDPGGRSLTN